ncbi:RNA polymerase sigma factor [Hymenobacter sp. GOD-10R]|uniref:RNA polymerase sigma factor n=1 Tax=Hymenobacter sp. GOD-10R TaxID=3093922 RepID=UPI002D775DB6|nr:sigma-70 family RNA polymerase sigma factor [Hymenobacter sp. GOD-10R]WRQ26784.1 sigma-70 family RNA polymerase sigma factor [Hymenobacter sp. GOD-10R]
MPAAHRTLYAAWSDDALVQALSKGDAKAFEEIYTRYWYPLFEVAHRKLNSREAAEELVQELFTALWHKREVHTISKLKPYLHSAIKYQIIDAIKSKITHAGYLAYTRPHLSDLDSTTEEVVAVADLSLALVASVQHLPEHTQQVFRLSRFEHQSVPEIAVRLNLSQKTVEYHLTRAMKMLRVKLKDFLPLVLFTFINHF